LNATLAEQEPTLTPSPLRPSRPSQQPPEGDRKTALVYIAGGITPAAMAAKASDPSAWDAYRTAGGISALMRDEALGQGIAAVLGAGDGLAAWMAGRAARRAALMAELEAEGWTPPRARLALGLGRAA
jgi:hypothetical protein